MHVDKPGWVHQRLRPLVLGALLFGGYANVCLAADQPAFFGHWITQKVVTSGPVSAYSTAQVRSFLGKELFYSKKRARYDGQAPIRPYYRTSSVSQDDFQFFNKVSFDEIGVHKQSITEVDVYTDKSRENIWDGPGALFFIKGSNNLILFQGGVFFELARKR